MAIGTTAAVAMGLAAAGSAYSAYQQNQNAKRQQAFGADQAEWLRSLMGAGPGAAEQWGMNWLNTGQDPMMQSQRTDPAARSAQTLEGIISREGDPFDTSELFRSLGVLDQRNLSEALATGRAAAPGLGQRFGGAQMREDSRVRERSTESAAARNAGIAMQSHGDAAARVLQAAGVLGQLGTAENAQTAAILQAILGAEASRRGANLNLAGMSLGMGAPVAGADYGQVATDIGSLLLLTQMGQQPAATPTYAPPAGWSMGGYRVPAYVPSVTTVPPNLNPVY